MNFFFLTSLFSAFFVLSSSYQCAAQEIVEVNYNHLGADAEIEYNRWIMGAQRRGVPLRLKRVSFGAGVDLNQHGVLELRTHSEGELEIVALFSTDICAIGAHLKVQARPSNSEEINLTFLRRDGSVIDIKKRWPAGGTTRQAYQAKEFGSRFAAVKITGSKTARFKVGKIKAVPCAYIGS